MINKIIRITLLVAAIIVGISGPASAMDTAQMISLFFSSNEILPGVETLTDIDLNNVTDIDLNNVGTL